MCRTSTRNAALMTVLEQLSPGAISSHHFNKPSIVHTDYSIRKGDE